VKSSYLDRISIAVWVVTITLAASAVLSLPDRGATVALGDVTFVFPFAVSSLFPVLLALLAGTGTEAVVRAHPLAGQGRLRLTIRFWALPVALTLIALVVQPLAPSVLYWAVGLLVFALTLAGVLVVLYFSLDVEATGYRRARAILNLVCYAIALLLFLLIPPAWSNLARSLVLGGVGSLLALELLRGTQFGGRLVGMYAAIVALVLVEVAAILPLTKVSALSGGLLLLLLFYLLVGLAWQSLLGRLNRRIALEFALVGAIGLILILLFVP
jgi:hypothetical protein